MLDAEDAIVAACSLDDVQLTVTEYGVDRWVMVHREDEPIINRTRPDYAEFSLQMVSDDWRKFGTELSGSTFLPSSSGGLSVPFAVPFTIDATQVTGQVSLTNPGNTTGPVRLRIDGPTTGPQIAHIGTGLVLTFASSLVLGVGEWLDVDMEAQTALANGQSSRAMWITNRGWSGFDPGDNTWSFTAVGYDPASKLTVYATPASQ
ncbi:phage tail family protein [Humibacter sp. RRB41]|uniref:phage tail family protein n=1 Tax=Humibacter sp. RRB41 TaxID=2919946 RepID=UPI001FAA888B|nr:phage tail family protein [Humibacter sp. RRB41]